MLQSIVGGKLAVGTGTAIQLNGTVVHGDNGGTGQVKSLSITSVVAGEMLAIAANATDTACTGLVIAQTAGTGTLVQGTLRNGSAGSSRVAFIFNASAGTNTISITASGGSCPANEYVQGGIARFQGIVTSSGLDQESYAIDNTGNSSTLTGSSITTSQAKELGIYMGTARAGKTWTAQTSPTSCTLLGSLDGGNYNAWQYCVYSTVQSGVQPNMSMNSIGQFIFAGATALGN